MNAELGLRHTDYNKQIPDHDLLIKHSVKLDTMCKLQQNIIVKLDSFIDKIDDRCEKRLDLITKEADSAVQNTTFWSLLTILVIVLMAMSATIGFNRTLSNRNEIQIAFNTAQIKGQLEAFDKLWKNK